MQVIATIAELALGPALNICQCYFNISCMHIV